jgi:alkylation response protein AidB-like acyl-CoA dehydrogenase
MRIIKAEGKGWAFGQEDRERILLILKEFKGEGIMQYQITEEQRMIRDNARKLARNKIAPRAAEIDATGEYPEDIQGILGEQGYLGLNVPEEYGGCGTDLLSYCLVLEEIAKVCGSSSLIMAGQELGMTPIVIAGNEEQKKKWLPSLANGDVMVAFGLTEPEAGSDVGSMRTKAFRTGEYYVLNGRKTFISNAETAQYYTVFAVTNEEKGIKGISTFVVEKGTPGFSFGKKEDKMGMRGSNTADLVFEDVKVPVANLLGEEGLGFTLAMKTLDKTRPGIGAQAVGIAQGALDFVLQYSKERRQFGKPIASFQGIQFMLADMATQIECARQLVYKSACMLDQSEYGLIGAKEASQFSAMAKLFASDTAMKVTVDAVQILGGYGYSKEYPVERMMRDAKITQIYEGTNQIQRLVIAKGLLG